MTAIDGRANAASAGPWMNDGGYRVLTPMGTVLADMKVQPGYPLLPSPADVAFMAAARTDVPRLLAEVRLRRRQQQAAQVIIGKLTVGDPTWIFQLASDPEFKEARDLLLLNPLT